MSKRDLQNLDEPRARALAARREEAQSAVRSALLQLSGRSSAEDLVARRRIRSTAYTYRSAWTDFASFMRVRFGEAPTASWPPDVTPLEREELLDYLDAKIGAITTNDVAAYRAAMLARPHRDRTGHMKVGLEGSTVNLRLSALRYLVRTARRLGLASDGIQFEFVDRMPAKVRFRNRPVPPEGLRKIFTAELSPRDRMMFTLLVRCGVRARELALTEPQHFFYQEERAPQKTGAVGLGGHSARGRGMVYGVYAAKGSRDRELLLPRDVETMVRVYLDEHARKRGPIIGLTRNSLIVRVRRLTKRLAGETYGPHRFRATFITLALRRGAQLHEVQIYAGHAKPETTMGYFEADIHRDRSAAEYLPEEVWDV